MQQLEWLPLYVGSSVGNWTLLFMWPPFPVHLGMCPTSSFRYAITTAFRYAITMYLSLSAHWHIQILYASGWLTFPACLLKVCELQTVLLYLVFSPDLIWYAHIPVHINVVGMLTGPIRLENTTRDAWTYVLRVHRNYALFWQLFVHCPFAWSKYKRVM